MLEHTLSTLHEYVQKVRKFVLTNEERAKISFEEHEAILNAIRNREADAAEQLAIRHMEKAVERLKNTDAVHEMNA